MKKLLLSPCLLLLFTGLSSAQRNQGIQRASGPNASDTPVTQISIEGVVESINLGLGNGSPQVIIQAQEILLAPYRVLMGQNFGDLQVGDYLEIEAFESSYHPGVYIALSVTWGESSFQFRDEFGIPLWTRSGAGFHARRGSRSCEGPGPDVSPDQVVTLSGKVKSLTVAQGQRSPVLTLDNDEIVKVGPARAWVETGFEVSPGEIVLIEAFKSPRNRDEWVAIQLQNSSQETFRLRDESGRRLYNRGTGRRTCNSTPASPVDPSN